MTTDLVKRLCAHDIAVNHEAADVIENLATLINRLCRQLNRVAPNNDVAVKAAEYMHRNNLLGTSLRRDDEGLGMMMDMIRNAGNTNDA